MVPHAGWPYSGAIAARAYKLLKRGDWDTVVVVATGHRKALEGAALYPGAYATPEGAMPYDESLAKALAAASPYIKFDAKAHGSPAPGQGEHSIEVQLPFLRHRLGPVKVVGLVMNTQDLEAARGVGRALARAAKGKRVLLIASSDQSHYPPGEVAGPVDGATLLALQTMDPSFFWLTNRFLMQRALAGLAVTYCGEGAVTAVMQAAKELGATKVQVLARANSGDVVPERDYHHVVGYAAAAFVKAARPDPPVRLDENARREALALARRSITQRLSDGKTPPAPLSNEPALDLPGAVFVTLQKRNGELRGCIGSLEPQETLAESIVHNAVAAAVSDTRFSPVTAGELDSLTIEISFLSRARSIASANNVKEGDGVIVEQDGRLGVFLPQVWERLPDRKAFLSELCEQKAHLARSCWKDPKTKFRTFSVELVRE